MAKTWEGRQPQLSCHATYLALIVATAGAGCEGTNVTLVLPPRAETPAAPGAGGAGPLASEPARGSSLDDEPGSRPPSAGEPPDVGRPPESGDGPASAGGAGSLAATPLPRAPERRGWLAFPEAATIEAPGWTTVEAFPGLSFDNPVGLHEAPNTGHLFVNERDGKIYAFPHDPAASEKVLVLDLSAVTQGDGDSGLLGMAFHPEFGQPASPHRGYVYLHYAFTETPVVGAYPEWNKPTRSRLSRFTVDLDTLVIDPASELSLIDQADDSVWHQGGALSFRPSDGFLYVTVGDEGGGLCQLDNCQRVDKDLFSGVLRIDVDQRGGDISHPIVRQPQTGVTQNYYIPNDNPFVGQPGVLEEFYAIGLRSPHKMTVDPVDDRIWLGDVAQGGPEEIDLVTPGANFQWPVMEGLAVGHAEMPATPLGVWTPPLVNVPRSEARSIIGGYVYRGQLHPELWGKYVFGDFATGNIWALDYEDVAGELQVGARELLFQSEFRDYEQNGLTSFAVDGDGELYLLLLGEGSKIRRLARTAGVSNVPRLLSQTGAFSDTAALVPARRLFPYDVASPLYSDGAEKQRWLVLPEGDGVSFSESGPFGFPDGTVFVKHFEIALDEREPTRKTRLETRFLVVGAGAQHYGVSYRWNEAGTDAEALLASEQALLEIVEQDGSVREQPYFFPGPGDCMQCHTAGAGHVLGVRTAQLNREIIYPGAEAATQQLRAWSELGLFRAPLELDALDEYPRLAALTDESRTVEERVRSYWDSNCSMCHGVTEIRASWDARFSTPLADQGILMRPPYSGPSADGNVLLAPGDAARSIIYERSRSTDPSLRMPPLGRNAADELYVELLEQWIRSLDGRPDARD